MDYQGIKCRIYPNKQQKILIECNFGYCRFVWNQLLELTKMRYQNNPNAPFLNRMALSALIPALKREYAWLRHADATSLQATVRDLTDAYQAFFEKRSGFPKFKSKRFARQSYRSVCNGRSIRQAGPHILKLPKLGLMRFRSGRVLPKTIKAATIERTPTGKYYAVLLVENESQVFDQTGMQIGLDFGVADLLIGSNGVKVPTIRFDKMLAKKKHAWEKRFARRLRQAQKEMAFDRHNKVPSPRVLSDFKNVQKAKHMIALYDEKIANQRQNYLHQITTQLVKRYDLIAIEDLQTKNLLKNHRLARALANQSWRELRHMLEYKCRWYGKTCIAVNPYKTSQICSDCGYDDGKHTLDIRVWICPQCQIKHDRDVNAAKNILQLGLGQALVKEL